MAILWITTQHGLWGGDGVLVFPALKTVQGDIALTPAQGSSGLQTGLTARSLPPRLAFVEESLFDVTQRSSFLHDNTLQGLLASRPVTSGFFPLVETQNSPESVSHDWCLVWGAIWQRLSGKYCEDRKLGRAAPSDTITHGAGWPGVTSSEGDWGAGRGKVGRETKRQTALRGRDYSSVTWRTPITRISRPHLIRLIYHLSNLLARISLQPGSAVIVINCPTVL